MRHTPCVADTDLDAIIRDPVIFIDMYRLLSAPGYSIDIVTDPMGITARLEP